MNGGWWHIMMIHILLNNDLPLATSKNGEDESGAGRAFSVGRSLF